MYILYIPSIHIHTHPHTCASEMFFVACSPARDCSSIAREMSVSRPPVCVCVCVCMCVCVCVYVYK